MTVRVWSWRQAIQQSRLGSTTKLVLLNLSIYMNDLGEGCFPSVRRQVADTGLSERAVYAALALAEKAGFLRRSKLRRNGVEQNEYVACYPADDHPAYGAGVQEVQPPPAPDAGPPLHVVQPNSPGKRSRERTTSPPTPSWPDWVPAEAWDAYVEMRRAKGAGMTAKAELLTLSKLDTLRRAGHDPAEVLNQSTMSNWTGIFPPKEDRHAHPGRHPARPDKPTWQSEGARLRAKYAAEADREEQGAAGGPAGAHLRLAEGVWEDPGGV